MFNDSRRGNEDKRVTLSCKPRLLRSTFRRPSLGVSKYSHSQVTSDPNSLPLSLRRLFIRDEAGVGWLMSLEGSYGRDGSTEHDQKHLPYSTMVPLPQGFGRNTAFTANLKRQSDRAPIETFKYGRNRKLTQN